MLQKWRKSNAAQKLDRKNAREYNGITRFTKATDFFQGGSGFSEIWVMREGEFRDPSGCAVVGVIDRSGKKMTGEGMIKAIEVMHDRSNGLGGGFAGYGIYPHYKDFYAFHLFFETQKAQEETEAFLKKHFEIVYASEIQTRKLSAVQNEPVIFRYFLAPLPMKLANSHLTEREYVARCVIRVNSEIGGAYVFSSGKNMGIFKGVGYPEDIGRFYRLEEYEGYAWTCHGRYPTNTPGWWGGAHPFGLLDLSVVHNGEISSYDANRRYMEMFGYKCTLSRAAAGAHLRGSFPRHRGVLLVDDRKKGRARAQPGSAPSPDVPLPSYHGTVLRHRGLHGRHHGAVRSPQTALHDLCGEGRQGIYFQRGERGQAHRTLARQDLLPRGRRGSHL